MKRVTHWQAAFALCFSLTIDFGSLWVFNVIVVNPQIVHWTFEYFRDNKYNPTAGADGLQASLLREGLAHNSLEAIGDRRRA
jgi:hypothetical protein